MLPSYLNAMRYSKLSNGYSRCRKDNAHKDACRIEPFSKPETFSKIKEIYGETTRSDSLALYKNHSNKE